MHFRKLNPAAVYRRAEGNIYTAVTNITLDKSLQHTSEIGILENKTERHKTRTGMDQIQARAAEDDLQVMQRKTENQENRGEKTAKITSPQEEIFLIRKLVISRDLIRQLQLMFRKRNLLNVLNLVYVNQYLIKLSLKFHLLCSCPQKGKKIPSQEKNNLQDLSWVPSEPYSQQSTLQILHSTNHQETEK